MYLILFFILILSGILQIGLSSQITNTLTTAGFDAPAIGFVLFSPIIEFAGGILLLFSVPSIKKVVSKTSTSTPSPINDPYTWAENIVMRWVGNGKILAELGSTIRTRLLDLREDFLEHKDNFRGFGFITVGFLIHIIALFWTCYVPVWISGLLTIFLAVYLILVKYVIRPKEENAAREYSEEYAIR